MLQRRMLERMREAQKAAKPYVRPQLDSYVEYGNRRWAAVMGGREALPQARLRVDGCLKAMHSPTRPFDLFEAAALQTPARGAEMPGVNDVSCRTRRTCGQWQRDKASS